MRRTPALLLPILIVAAIVTRAQETDAPPFPAAAIYAAAHAPYSQTLQIQGLKQTFEEQPGGTYRGEITSSFEQDREHRSLGKREIDNHVGRYRDMLPLIGFVRGKDGVIASTEAALGLEDKQPEFLVASMIRMRSGNGPQRCVIAVSGVSSITGKDGSLSYSGQPLGLLSGCGMTPELVAGPGDLPTSQYKDPGMAEEDRALQLQMLVMRHLGRRVVVTETTADPVEEQP